MIPSKRRPIREESTQGLLALVAACAFGIVILSNEVVRPIVDLFQKPVAVPAAQNAAEGDVWISNHLDSSNNGDYSLRTGNGRWTSLYCGPWPYDELCLHEVGLTPGRTYRLTVAYYTETLTGGVKRNIITHARLGQRDLVTPDGQVEAWRSVTTFYDSKRGRYATLRLDGGFWLIYAVLAAVYSASLWTFSAAAVELVTRGFAGKTAD